MQPNLAPVRPRFVSSATSDSLLLDDSVREAFRHFPAGVVEVAGPPGSGKTSAVLHLLAALSREWQVELMPVGDLSDSTSSERRIIAEVELNSQPLPNRIARFELARWGMDEYIEYALAVHPEQHQSVISRLLASGDRSLLDGCAELSAVVIDCMARSPEIQTVAEALRAEMTGLTDNDNSRLPLPGELLGKAAWPLHDQRRMPLDEKLRRLLRHPSVRLIAAAMQIAEELNSSSVASLQTGIPARGFRTLTDVVFPVIGADGVAFLHKALKTRRHEAVHPVLASILFRVDPKWRPERSRPELSGAILRRANWDGIDLRSFSMDGADLSDSQLNRARMNAVKCESAKFDRSSLKNSTLVRIVALSASFRDCDLTWTNAALGHFPLADFQRANVAQSKFSKADLSEANLSNACFRSAKLDGAALTLAKLENTDFTNADFSAATLLNVDLSDAILDGAVFDNADLSGSHLENVKIAAGRFSKCWLVAAHLTGSSLPNANMRAARLVGAYMADIDWPGTDLRNADLSGCTFHMGSSRSGLVHSDIASEGTRTGFYSADYDDHLYRRPEEIRAANLCNCDLRGANITAVDFYRVDLRGARYDDGQRQQFVATGAILE